MCKVGVGVLSLKDQIVNIFRLCRPCGLSNESVPPFSAKASVDNT